MKRWWIGLFVCSCLGIVGCDDGDGCTDGDIQCNEQGNKLMVCKGGKWKAQKKCDYMCTNNQCLECETNGVDKCRSNSVYTCQENMWTLKEACTQGCKSSTATCYSDTEPPECENNDGCPVDRPICDHGTCVSGSAPECENNDGCPEERPICDHGTCVSGSTPECENNDGCPVDRPICDHGTCVSGSTPECENNDGCPEERPICDHGVCVEDGGVTPCTQTEKKCADDGSAVLECQANTWVSIKPCSHGCSQAQCLDAPACTGDTKQCDDAKENVMVCEGGKWIVSEPCQHGCQAATCKPEPLSPDFGEACDPAVRKPSCKDSTLISCRMTLNASYEFGYTVAATACSENGGICEVFEDVGSAGNTVGGCFTSADECTSGATQKRCMYDVSGKAFLHTLVCQASSQTPGKNYLVDAGTSSCEYGCAEDMAACATKLVSDQGEACDSSASESCEGDVLRHCGMDRVVEAFSCKTVGMSCVEFENGADLYVADCASTSSDCVAGATKKACRDMSMYGLDMGFSTTLECKKTRTGDYYWQMTASSFCESDCDAATGLCN